jgi:hypothetical protein
MDEKRPTLSEEEIDEIVTAHADDDSAWEKPIRVRRNPEIFKGINDPPKIKSGKSRKRVESGGSH